MSILKIVLISLSAILVIFALFKLNYKNLSWKENKVYYGNIFTGVCVMLAMLLSF